MDDSHPLFGTFYLLFQDVVTAMDRCDLIDSGGNINPEAKGMDGRAVRAGPVDVAQRMKDLRQWLEDVPGHGVDLDEFGRILERWNQAAQLDQVPGRATFEKDRGWMAGFGQAVP